MMPLTAYTAHLIAIWALVGDGDPPQSWFTLTAFSLATMTLALIWLRQFRSGPLELGLRAIANAASRR